MKLFGAMEIQEAYDWSRAGGQALHVWYPCRGVASLFWDASRAPGCFVREAKAGRAWAHLFDQDHERLIETARRLGVNVILVSNEGTHKQHVDLCGRPLERAVAEALGAEGATDLTALTRSESEV